MRPLDGVRVLDVTRLLPGSYATLLLADLGADVVKVEDPRGGDGMRTLPLADGRNVYFELLNRNKRSVTLDLRSPDAAAVLDALCAHADVIVDSFRPSTARRLRVDPAVLRARHPHLVCASISGFGQSGPYAERAAHDINYQALAGLLFARGSTRSTRLRAGPFGRLRAGGLNTSEKGCPRPERVEGRASDAGSARGGHRRRDADGNRCPRGSSAAGANGRGQRRRCVDSRGRDGLVDVSVHVRSRERLLCHVRDGGRPLACARGARAKVLDRLLRAHRTARPRAASARAGRRAGAGVARRA
ncbi:MAG: hypothetical protein DMF95_33425 [Acidobacteria bacterium]|nr:MAG: hypothetical protein DMF95_33425 [Acidobacteriota bacterium]